MNDVEIIIGSEAFKATFQTGLAPRTCAAFKRLLPWRNRMIHVRWSGEGCWVPLGEFDLGVDLESPTAVPRRGQILFYPGRVSEAELIMAYGCVRFACNAGAIAGNPLLQITSDLEPLSRLGHEMLWNGAKDILIRMAGSE